MAHFAYTQLLNYRSDLSFSGSLDTGSNWPDWDGDNQFEQGDAGLTTGPYLGTVLIQDVLAPVFQGRNSDGVYTGYVVIYPGEMLAGSQIPSSIPGPRNEVFRFGGPQPTTGNDNLSGNRGADTVDLLAGRDVYKGFGGNDTVYGRAGADRIMGGAGADVLDGGAGRDRLLGGSGKDDLKGGAGNDVLLGGSGNDILNGGKSDDRLLGGSGDDTLAGGGGKDVFVFEAKRNGHDVIQDFQTGRDRMLFNDVVSFDDLSISRVKEGTLVTWDAGSVLLEDIKPNALDADDFSF